MLFFRQFQHLLPDAKAWRTTIANTLRRFFEGLTAAPSDARDYIDAIYEDIFPDTTRELEQWEKQFGLTPNPNETIRRLNLAAEWAATGGQSPSYIQGVLQTAGFNVFVHDPWALPIVPPDPNYIAIDPRAHTTKPTFGTFQCSSLASQPEASGPGIVGRPVCDGLLANDPGYLANQNLTQLPPPLVPDDASTWLFFFYVGDAVFPNRAIIDTERRVEFERLLLKLKPAHVWVVTLIDFEQTDTFFFGAGSEGWGESVWA